MSSNQAHRGSLYLYFLTAHPWLVLAPSWLAQFEKTDTVTPEKL